MHGHLMFGSTMRSGAAKGRSARRLHHVWIEAFTAQVMRLAKAKRGIPLTANSMNE